MSLTNHFRMKDNVDVYYADVANVIMNAIRGNKVKSGGGLTGTVTLLTVDDIHVNVAAGSVYITGVKKTMTSLAVNLFNEYALLSSGQELWVYVYVGSTGAVATANGSATTIGQAIPPDFDTLGADVVILARIMLTFGDTTVTADDITDLRLDLPNVTATDKIATDTIGEETVDAGVTIDGLLIKDGALPGLNTNVSLYANFDANGTTYAWVADKKYIESTPAQVTEYCKIYFDMPVGVTSLDIRAENIENGVVSGNIRCWLEECVDGGSWSQVGDLIYWSIDSVIESKNLPVSVTVDETKKYRLNFGTLYSSGTGDIYGRLYGIMLNYD